MRVRLMLRICFLERDLTVVSLVMTWYWELLYSARCLRAFLASRFSRAPVMRARRASLLVAEENRALGATMAPAPTPADASAGLQLMRVRDGLAVPAAPAVSALVGRAPEASPWFVRRRGVVIDVPEGAVAGSRAIVSLPDDGDARHATVTIAFPPGLSTGQELTVALEV